MNCQSETAMMPPGRVRASNSSSTAARRSAPGTWCMNPKQTERSPGAVSTQRRGCAHGGVLPTLGSKLAIISIGHEVVQDVDVVKDKPREAGIGCERRAVVDGVDMRGRRLQLSGEKALEAQVSTRKIEDAGLAPFECAKLPGDIDGATPAFPRRGARGQTSRRAWRRRRC